MQKESNQLHFILIDENEIDLFLHEKLIRSQGISTRITSFLDVLQALDHILPFQDTPDLYPDTVILLDIRMSGTDGFEFLNYFERMPDRILAKTRIFIVSSSLDYSDIMRSHAHHLVDKFLAKPLDPDELKRVIKENMI